MQLLTTLGQWPDTVTWTKVLAGGEEPAKKLPHKMDFPCQAVLQCVALAKTDVSRELIPGVRQLTNMRVELFHVIG